MAHPLYVPQNLNNALFLHYCHEIFSCDKHDQKSGSVIWKCWQLFTEAIEITDICLIHELINKEILF